MEIGFNVENEVFSRAAQRQGVEIHAFWEEIRFALDEARKSKEPAARAFWETVPEDATTADIVRRIVEMV